MDLFKKHFSRFFIRIVLFFVIAIIQCTDHEKIIQPVEMKYSIDQASMLQEAIVNHKYIDTVHLVYDNLPAVFPKLILLNAHDTSMEFHDSIFTWVPSKSATGFITIQIGLMLTDKVIDTVSWTINVKGFWPESCPEYTHKDDVTVSDASLLPRGFFVYNISTQTGLYKSDLQYFDPQLIPNTSADRPGNISISDDGKWICYVDRSRLRICLMTVSGCNKTIVPVSNTESGFPTIAGFYRKSPYTTEIFYLASYHTLRSVSVNFSKTEPSFSNDRVLANLNNKCQFNPYDFTQMSVVRDQIFFAICIIVDGNIHNRTAYLTIPDAGRGVGSEQDIYQWKNDSMADVYGCGHTQSQDGSLCLANAGTIGNGLCVSQEHKGFYITAFRRVTDPPIDLITEHVDKYAISINWCPIEYQKRSFVEADFWGWYFGNRNDLVIGRQMGTLSDNGIWMVDWKNNIWYRLSPIEKNIQALQPAVFFYPDSTFSISPEQCIEDTSEKPLPYDPNADFYNPHYRIKYPNNGEVFTVGKQCSVSVTCTRPGNALLNISLNRGKTWCQLPGLNRAINPFQDSCVVFLIPDSIFNGKTMVPTISTTCLLLLKDYGNPNYYDITDSTFSIIKE